MSVRLKAELDRLATANPFEALGLDFEATAAQIRASFLELTKKFHPSRYARMDREVFKLANEVFLRVKDAYGRLSDETSRTKVLETFAAKERAPTATWRSKSPAPPPPPTSKPSGPTTRRSIARGTPSSRRTAERLRAHRPTPGRDRGTGSQPSRRPTTANEIAAGLADTYTRLNEEYEMALKMITQGRYGDARTVFRKIAAEDPKTKKYRVQMHYSWGLEHEDAGRFEDARKEFERALSVDPEFKRAHEAIDRLPRDKKGSGFFSKIFGR